MTKKCFKCGKEKDLNDFYKHPQMPDGHVNKCKECNKIDNKVSNGKEIRVCVICGKNFNTTINEIKRRGGGANCCSRECYYKRFKNIVKKGSESHNWNGGKIKTSSGYIIIYNKKHPRANKSGYVFEHLLVMEDKLKRVIKKEEVVHHINGDKTDNRIENLRLFHSNGEHIAFHWEQERMLGVDRFKKAISGSA